MISRKNLLFAFLLVSASFAVTAQENHPAMNGIRKEVSAINNRKSWKIVELTHEEFLTETPDGGGRLTGYFQNGKMQKMVKWIGISHGVEVVEYYYKNDELIFILEQFRNFRYDSATRGIDHTKMEVGFEGRYYFSGKKLIHLDTKGHNRPGNERVDPGAVLAKEADEWKIKLTTARARAYSSSLPGISRYGDWVRR